MAEAPVSNLVVYVALALAPTALCWAAIRIPRLVERLRRPEVVAAGPSIEKVSADLRRVHRLLTGFEPGTSAVRRLGARAAYDALLIQACRVVDVEHRLAELPEGIDRDLERLRVEESLRDAGLVIP